jgi:hypothetical protein
VNFLNKIHFFFLRQHGFFFPQKGQIDSDAAGVMKLPHPRIFSDKLRIFRLRYITLTDQNFISSSASVVGVASFFSFFRHHQHLLLHPAPTQVGCQLKLECRLWCCLNLVLEKEKKKSLVS